MPKQHRCGIQTRFDSFIFESNTSNWISIVWLHIVRISRWMLGYFLRLFFHFPLELGVSKPFNNWNDRQLFLVIKVSNTKKKVDLEEHLERTVNKNRTFGRGCHTYVHVLYFFRTLSLIEFGNIFFDIVWDNDTNWNQFEKLSFVIHCHICIILILPQSLIVLVLSMFCWDYWKFKFFYSIWFFSHMMICLFIFFGKN